MNQSKIVNQHQREESKSDLLFNIANQPAFVNLQNENVDRGVFVNMAINKSQGDPSFSNIEGSSVRMDEDSVRQMYSHKFRSRPHFVNSKISTFAKTRTFE